jgi:hypothetical protein
MAFPNTPLPVKAYLAPGADPAGDQSDWAWQDRTADVRVASGITIEVGKGDEAARTDPGKCALVFNNRDGHYSTRNPLGNDYGVLSKNDPLRITVGGFDDTFNRVVANGWGTSPSGLVWGTNGGAGGSVLASQYAVDGSKATFTVPVAAAYRHNSMTGLLVRDADATVTTTVPGVTTVSGGDLEPANIMFRRVSTTRFYMARCTITTAGAVRAVLIGPSGVPLADVVVPSLTWTGQALKVHARISGAWFGVRIWAASDPEPTVWHATSNEATDDVAGLIGLRSGAGAGNTNVPVTAAFDDLLVEVDQFLGTVPEWPTRWDKGRDCWTPVQAAGILRRLQQSKAPLRSPIARNFLRYTPVGYWTLEDGSSSTTAASAITDAQPAAAYNVSFAGDDTLPGSATAVKLSASSRIIGKVPAHTGTGKWSVVFYAKLLAAPAADTIVMQVTTTGTVRRFDFLVGPTGYYLHGYDDDDIRVIDTASVFPADAHPTDWVAFDLAVEQIGGNVKAVLLFNGVGRDTNFYFMDDTTPGTYGRPTGWDVRGSLGLNDAAMAHVYVINGGANFVDGDFTRASYGYTGETDVERVTRLCAEENVPLIVEAGPSSTMGPQKPDTFLNLLYAAEDAGLGVLTERGAGLGYRARGARYNRPVAMALDFDAGHVSEPPEPTDDDQQIRNDITVSRPGGSEARSVDEADVIKHGKYEGGGEINVEVDGVLPDHARWRRHLGTFDGQRWSRIDMNIAARPALLPVWLSAGLGSRATFANPPSQAAGDDVDVIVEGYVVTLGPFDFAVALNTSPAGLWRVAVEGVDRFDTGGSELDTAVNASATTLLVNTLLGPRWTTDPAMFPPTADLLVKLGGEVVSVTSITGTTNPQTFTVVRGINGITKGHAADTPVSLAYPARAAL